MTELPENMAAANSTLNRLLAHLGGSGSAGRDSAGNIAGNVLWRLADTLLRMGGGFLLGIWIARYLGPGQFGLLSYALAFVALFAPLGMVGLDDIVVRNLVRNPADNNALLGTTFLLKLAGGLVSVPVIIAVIVWLRPGDPASVWLVAILAAGSLFQAFNTIELWFNARVQAKYPVIAGSSAFLVCVVGKIALIIAGAPLVAFAWIALLETALTAVGLVVVYLASGQRLGEWAGRRRIAGALLRDSWPLLFSCMVMVVYLRIDQIMLGQMAGSEAVGIYSVAVRLAEVWLFFSAAVYWSVLPSLVELQGVSEELFYQRLQRYYNLMALCAYIIAIPISLAADWLVPFLFGPAYAAAAPMLTVLVWANLFIFLESARSAFFNVMNWYRVHFVTVALGTVVNIVLNLLLIPRHGGLGAAVASCIAYWFAAHGSCFLFKPLRRTGWMLTRALVFPKVW